MPRKSIDYSKCVIYKLCCNDPTITDIYVGHTTDKIRRKNCHKNRCNNQNSKECNLYVYQIIRENGGWDNWSLVVLQEYPCENKNQAEMRERYWIETLQATLNRQIPTRTIQEWHEEHKEQKKIYYEENKEEHKKRMKIYYEENKEQLKNHMKMYRQEHEKEIKEQKSKKIICECGSTILKNNKSNHLKTEKHNNYLNSLNHELI